MTTPSLNSSAPDMLALAQEARKARAEAVRDLFVKAGAFVARIAKSVVRPFKEFRTRQKAYEELMGLDDTMLRDLGISRAQIRFIVSHGREAEVAANANEPRRAA
ncbi:MAG: RSP_7527 family protein [Alphaproteobacteria bacterium]